MANEGIMALPQGMDMPAEEAPEQQLPVISSAESYDAAQTALGMVDPQGRDAAKQAVREAIGDMQLTQEQIDILLEVTEYMSQHPGEYDQIVQQLIQEGYIDQGDLPDQYDPEFMGMLLIVLNEMQSMRGQGAMEPMQMSPTVEGLQPLGMAEGGLADVASYLAAQGRNGDSMLAHITPEEAELLRKRGGSGTINPVTGLPEFFFKKVFKSIGNAFKSVGRAVKKALKSPLVRIIATIALATVLGPAGMALMSSATAAGVAGAGVTLMGGGSLKEALISGAMGYVGGGGTIMGTSPMSAVGGYLPGAAGSALNTGLSTGVIGAGIGKLSGMSTQDALKMGMTSGLSAAAMQGARNSGLINEGRVTKEDILRAQGGEGTPATGTDRFAGPNAIGEAVPTGPVGPAGTAQDMLAAKAANYSPANYGFDNYGTAATDTAAPGLRLRGGFLDADSYVFGGKPDAPIDYSLAPTRAASNTGLDGFRASSGMIGAAPGAPTTGAAVAPGADMMGPSPNPRNYDLGPEFGKGSPPNILDRMATGAKDLYNEYLSPDRPGLPKDAGPLTKYGPLALATYGTVAAFGGTKGEPANQNPVFNRDYTGDDYIRDNPSKFSGGLDLGYVPPSPPRNPIVETPSYASIPIGRPGVVMPGGITQSPGGVAQPYNVAGLYGVPLIYGPDGRPQRLAKGGQPQPTYFPRKNGPINGPGTGTSDDIPAMLSDGEFVFTAKAVRNAGGGSRRKGAARMYKLMKKLEGGAV